MSPPGPARTWTTAPPPPTNCEIWPGAGSAPPPRFITQMQPRDGVGEEQGTVVVGRVVRSVLEGDPGDRGAADRARVAGHDLRAVVVGVERPGLAGSGIERLAAVQVRSVVAALPAGALVARPAEVLRHAVVDVRDPVDLLPGVPADVADPELLRAGPETEPERVAQAVGDDAAGVVVGARGERVAGQPHAGVRVDPDDRAVERHRLTGRPAHRLRSQRTALGGGRRQVGARRRRRITAGVLGLAVVDVVVARPVAGTRVQRPVRAEPDGADGVAGELLAPAARPAPARRRSSGCRWR